MMITNNPFNKSLSLSMPDNTFIAGMQDPERLENPKTAIMDALLHPIGCESLIDIAVRKRGSKEDAKAVVTVSDNTRPVPYKGDEGILMPVIFNLIDAGYKTENITVLIATGTHKAMSSSQIKNMLDSRIFELGIKVVNHNCRDESGLTNVGTTARGTKAMINSVYMNADMKIVTGLVESHFMAGASGGRKGICPGIIGEQSTYVFHGPALMDAENSRDLILEGNPVHEESLEVARLAGVDFLVNVTLDGQFHLTGIFAGDLEKAHIKAVEKLKQSVQVSVPYEADIVITHGGFAGINHYQCAKCAVASLGVLKKNGYLIILADTKDPINPIGNATYRTCLSLMNQIGAQNFTSLIKSPSWTFIPDQWEVQQWAKVFKRIPSGNLFMYSPYFSHSDFDTIPGFDTATLVKNKSCDMFQSVLDAALSEIASRTGRNIEEMRIVYMKDGPYDVPQVKN